MGWFGSNEVEMIDICIKNKMQAEMFLDDETYTFAVCDESRTLGDTLDKESWTLFEEVLASLLRESASLLRESASMFLETLEPPWSISLF